MIIATLDAFGGELAGRRIFIGGPGVVGIATALLARLPALEAVVVGEGETALAQLVTRSLAHGSMAGVWTRDEYGSVHGHGQTPRENLNRFATLPWQRFRGGGYSRIPMSTMRGCPFDCEFCEIIAFMGRKVATRDLDLSFADLDEAQDQIGSGEIDVLDDTFTVNPRRVHRFCERMKARDRRVAFSVYSRVDTIDEPMMEALGDAGCTRVFFGIDSADDTVLTRVHKRIRIADVLPVLRRAAECFDVTASLIWGFPFESREAFDATLAFARSCLEQSARFRIQPQLHLLSPSAGTPLFDTYGDRLLLDEYVEGTTYGTLSANAFRPQYDRVVAVMRENPVLAAPFHRYETPDFFAKARVVEAFSRELDVAVGRGVDALLQESEHAESNPLCRG